MSWPAVVTGPVINYGSRICTRRRDVTVVGDDGDSGAFLVQPAQQGEGGAADRTLRCDYRTRRRLAELRPIFSSFRIQITVDTYTTLFAEVDAAAAEAVAALVPRSYPAGQVNTLPTG